MAETVNRRFGWAALGVLVAVALLGPLVFALAELMSLSRQVTALGERQGNIEQRLEAALRALEEVRSDKAERSMPAPPPPRRAPAEPESVTPPAKPQPQEKPASLAAAAKPARPALTRAPAVVAMRPAVEQLAPASKLVTSARAGHFAPQLFAEPTQAAPEQLADRRLGL